MADRIFSFGAKPILCQITKQITSAWNKVAARMMKFVTTLKEAETRPNYITTFDNLQGDLAA